MCRNLAIFGQNLVEFWVHKGTFWLYHGVPLKFFLRYVHKGTFWLYHGVPLKFSSVNKESSVLR